MSHSTFHKVVLNQLLFRKTKQNKMKYSLSTLYIFVFIFSFIPLPFNKLLLILLNLAQILSPVQSLHQFPHSFSYITLCSGISCSHILQKWNFLCKYILQRCKAEVTAHRSLYPSHPAQCLEYSRCSVNNFFFQK